MKLTATIARYLLGFIFLVFGLNGFLHFIPQPPLEEGAAKQFLGALVASHYTVAIFTVQLVGGILLLVNRYVPLALTLLGPVIVNIILFHLLMLPSGLPPALLVLVLWCLLAYRMRSAFDGIFEQRAR